jgi:hypothetical protein
MVAAPGLLVACSSGASWRNVRMPDGYQAPKEATLTVVARDDQARIASAVAEGVIEKLADHSIHCAFVGSNRPDADIRVNIREWDEGSQFLRYLISFGAGEAKVVVSVSSAAGVEGVAEGWLRSGWFGGEAEDAGKEVGKLIGATIAHEEDVPGPGSKASAGPELSGYGLSPGSGSASQLERHYGLRWQMNHHLVTFDFEIGKRLGLDGERIGEAIVRVDGRGGEQARLDGADETVGADR